MADIELVIKIPEELLEYFANHNCMSEDGWFSHSSKLLDAFCNGTPLPKGHGRIVDIDKLIDSKCNDCGHIKGVSCTVPCYEVRRMLSASTIIEADKGYEVEAITRGNCMMCGKELTEGLLFCKKCEAKIMQGRGEKKPCNLKPTDKYFQYSCCPYYREGFCGRGEYDRKCAWESKEGKCTYYQDEAESEEV